MKRLFFCHALSLVLAATLLTACSDDDEARMPVPEPVSAEYFESCVGGKGWQYVESHEIKANGTIEKKDYWEGLFGGSQIISIGNTVNPLSRSSVGLRRHSGMIQLTDWPDVSRLGVRFTAHSFSVRTRKANTTAA